MPKNPKIPPEAPARRIDSPTIWRAGASSGIFGVFGQASGAEWRMRNTVKIDLGTNKIRQNAQKRTKIGKIRKSPERV